MTGAFDIKVSSERVERLLGRLPSTLERLLAEGQIQMAEEHIEAVKRRMKTAGDGLVKTRTGNLQRGMTRVQQRSGKIDGLQTRVFVAGVKYADAQEYGAVIRPVRRKYLTIPLDAIKTAAGAIKGQYSGGAGEYRKRGTSFVVKLGGKLFVAERTGKSGKLKLLWLLVKQSVIPGNLGWFKTWRAAAPDRRVILDRIAKQAVSEAQR